MNRRLLQKVIDELQKESPKLDYIRGVLETLLESFPEEIKKIAPDLNPTALHVPYPKVGVINTSIVSDDPVIALETTARARIASIQKAEIQ